MAACGSGIEIGAGEPCGEYKFPQTDLSVGPPPRCWRQCVENQLICDQVRRPLARLCHKREMPPLVLPRQEMDRFQMEITQKQRERDYVESMRQNRERQRMDSHCRHSLWKYTPESLLERKRSKEAEKLRKEAEDTQQLLAEMEAERDRNSEEWTARARKLMLYRKGLIRDFHAAMANSKMLKELADEKNNGRKGQNENSDKRFPSEACMNRMMAANQNPEYKPWEYAVRPNPKKLEAIQRDEKRAPERQCEIEKVLEEVKLLRTTCPLDVPESCTKEPSKDDGDVKKRQQMLREELFSQIHDKLAMDAFIEAHEQEIDRQACEYNKYRRTIDHMRKEKEKEAIANNVACNILASEKAAEALVQMQQKRQARTNDYDAIRKQWEEDLLQKENARGEARHRKIELVKQDFCERKNMEPCKWQSLDASRQWSCERLVAVENYNQECERKNERRKEAEDLALFHLAQMEDKRCRDMQEKRMNSKWACKEKNDYEREINEMKAYAGDCIKDWESKGRPTKPLLQAVKRWDYDSGMYPFANSMEVLENNMAANKMKNVNCPKYETTSIRLGFDNPCN